MLRPVIFCSSCWSPVTLTCVTVHAAVCRPAVAVSQQDSSSEDPSDAAPPALCWSVSAPPPSICRSEACSSTYVTAATSRPHVTQPSYRQFFKRFPARIETSLYLLINVLTELLCFSHK